MDLRESRQGTNRQWEENDGKPWTRGFTLGQARESEWCAEIYDDVVLDKSRLSFPHWDPAYGVDRILIGAPQWVWTPKPARCKCATETCAAQRGSGGAFALNLLPRDLRCRLVIIARQLSTLPTTWHMHNCKR
jgi:hypothetical protein